MATKSLKDILKGAETKLAESIEDLKQSNLNYSAGYVQSGQVSERNYYQQIEHLKAEFSEIEERINAFNVRVCEIQAEITESEKKRASIEQKLRSHEEEKKHQSQLVKKKEAEIEKFQAEHAASSVT